MNRIAIIVKHTIASNICIILNTITHLSLFNGYVMYIDGTDMQPVCEFVFTLLDIRSLP